MAREIFNNRAGGRDVRFRRWFGERRSDRGATVVEMAIVLNICLVFLLGIFDYGRAVMIRQVLDNAAREAARLAVVSTNSLTTAQIQAEVTKRLAGQQLSSLNIQVYKADPVSGASVGLWTDAGLGECIAVDVTGNYQPLAPLFSRLASFQMRTKSVMYSEAN